MATFALGDIQGCFDSLESLLRMLDFSSKRDKIFPLGDMVNRGPKSLEVLRWAKGLGEACMPVLGNHDLHLLGRAYGAREARPRDTLDEILAAPDRNSLLDWLVKLPFIREWQSFLFVHAGLLPQWSKSEAMRWGTKASSSLQNEPSNFLNSLFASNYADRWRSSLPDEVKTVTAAAALTRIRTCDPTGKMNFKFSGSPDQAPLDHLPWFKAIGRQSESAVVVFGHWAALGLSVGPTWTCLDTGCIWGRQLTAMRLEDGKIFSQPAKESAR